MYAIVNSQLINELRVRINPFSPGYQYGYGVFETIKISVGKAIFLHEHYIRMMDGLTALQMVPEKDYETIALQCEQLIKANHLKNGYLKIICSRDEQNTTHWILMTGEKQYISEYQQGLRLCLSNARRNEFSPLCRIKSLNYLENILQHEQAIRQGYDEAVFLNTRDQVCEGTTSNLFWLKDHQLYTPNLTCGLLPGIARQKVIEMCTELGLNVNCGAFGLDEMRRADSIFLTNSLMDIMPVSQFENKHYDLKSSDETHKLMELYQNRYLSF